MTSLPIVDATAFAEGAVRTVAAQRTVIAEAIAGMIWAMRRDSVLDDGPAFDRLHDAAARLNEALGLIDDAAVQLIAARKPQ